MLSKSRLENVLQLSSVNESPDVLGLGTDSGQIGLDRAKQATPA